MRNHAGITILLVAMMFFAFELQARGDDSSSNSSTTTLVPVLKTYRKEVKPDRREMLQRVEESLRLLSIGSEFRRNPEFLKASLEKMSEKVNGLMKAEGYEPSALLRNVSGLEMKDLRNKADRILAAVEMMKEIHAHRSATGIVLYPFYEIGSMREQIIIANPSLYDERTLAKVYLPKEIIPEDVIDAGGMKMSYDRWKKQYFAYQENFFLKPHEIRLVSIHMDDVWQVTDGEIRVIENQMQESLQKLLNTTRYHAAKNIVDSIRQRLAEIVQSQSDESVSREEHMQIHRDNLLVMDQIQKDTAVLENILWRSGAKPSSALMEEPDDIAGAEWTAWRLVLGLIICMGLTGAFFYLKWFFLMKSRRSYPRPDIPSEDEILRQRQELKQPDLDNLEGPLND